jgi:hypothetical protein
MIKVFFIIIALFFGFQIFFQPNIKKLPWFFAGILFFPPAILLIESPHIPFHKFIVYCLLLATIKDFKWVSKFKIYPLKNALYVMFIAYLIIGLFDSRLSLFYKIYKPINYFVENFLVLFLTGYCVKSVKDVKYLYKKFFWFFLVFTIYGISNYITRQNEFYNFIVSGFGGRNFANDNMVAGIDRFRVSSFSWHAIVYGFLLSTILMHEFFLLTTMRMGRLIKMRHIVLVLLIIINLFLVNSRTPLFVFVLGCFIYILFTFNFKRKIKIILVSSFIGVVAIVNVPAVDKLFNESVKTFSSEGSDLEGSSVEMREIQLGASVLIFNQNPVYGNGFDYITENLGYSSDESERKTGNDLMGFESYIYKLLIEHGITGIVANIIFFILIVYWLLKSIPKVNALGRKVIILNFAYLISFISFIIGTGDLGTFVFFMSFLGVNIKLVELCKKDVLINKCLS